MARALRLQFEDAQRRDCKSGMVDSNVTSYPSKHATDPGCGPPPGGMIQMMSSIQTTVIFSVWDRDWAIEKYLHGYHGLVKTYQSVATIIKTAAPEIS
jgi:hypothetical protein